MPLGILLFIARSVCEYLVESVDAGTVRTWVKTTNHDAQFSGIFVHRDQWINLAGYVTAEGGEIQWVSTPSFLEIDADFSALPFQGKLPLIATVTSLENEEFMAQLPSKGETLLSPNKRSPDVTFYAVKPCPFGYWTENGF